MGHVLLVRDPGFVEGALRVGWVSDVIIYCSNVVVVDSVFDIVKVFVSCRHSDFAQFIQKLLLGVSSCIFNQLISVGYYFPERLLRLFIVYL